LPVCRVVAPPKDVSPTAREHCSGQHVATRSDADSPSGSTGVREITVGQHVAHSDAPVSASRSPVAESGLLPPSGSSSM
jgi:hypothetical protein